MSFWRTCNSPDVKILVFDRYSSIITPLRLVFSGTVAVKRLRGVVGGSAEKAIVTVDFFLLLPDRNMAFRRRGGRGHRIT